MNDDRVGLLTIIRARRKWYLGVYFAQMFIWTCALAIHQIYFAPTATNEGTPIPTIQRVIDTGVNMSFLAQGNLVATVFWIDVVFDGCRYVIVKGVEGLGLIFSPIKNRFSVAGEKKGREKTIQSLSQDVEARTDLDPKAKEVINEILKGYDQRNGKR